MLIRKSSKGHDLQLYRNTTPGAVRTKKFKDGTTETLTYPSSKKYFLVFIIIEFCLLFTIFS